MKECLGVKISDLSNYLIWFSIAPQMVVNSLVTGQLVESEQLKYASLISYLCFLVVGTT